MYGLNACCVAVLCYAVLCFMQCHVTWFDFPQHASHAVLADGQAHHCIRCYDVCT